MNLDAVKNIHILGIKGTGMSGLALLLHTLGYKVSGSDTRYSFYPIDKKEFTKRHIKITDFATKNITKSIDLAITTSVYHTTGNVEFKALKKLKIPVVYAEEVLGLLSKKIPTVSIAGTHGKTTATNLLAHILLAHNIPIITLGGPTPKQALDAMTKIQVPELFVLESDEYRNKFSHYRPFGAIITNIERDHPDLYKTDAQYIKMFKDFVQHIPKEGFLIYCADDTHARKLAKFALCTTIGYGTRHGQYRVSSTQSHRFTITRGGTKQNFKTPLIGIHNALNATAVALAADILGVSVIGFQKALSSFKGSDRRLELISKKPLIYDDYGHHPTEIKATLAALRQAYPKKKIITVFQPHTYTRTEQFLKEFGIAFDASDVTILLDIWGSAREYKGNVHATDLMKEIGKNGGKTLYFPTRAGAAKALKNMMTPNSLILTIGATDIWKIHKLLK